MKEGRREKKFFFHKLVKQGSNTSPTLLKVFFCCSSFSSFLVSSVRLPSSPFSYSFPDSGGNYYTGLNGGKKEASDWRKKSIVDCRGGKKRSWVKTQKSVSPSCFMQSQSFLSFVLKPARKLEEWVGRGSRGLEATQKKGKLGKVQLFIQGLSKKCKKSYELWYELNQYFRRPDKVKILNLTPCPSGKSVFPPFFSSA